MALDLDSLLSNSNIDDDDDGNDDEQDRESLPHRTIEEILNDDSLSSSSSSPPPSPKPFASSLDHYDDDYDVVSSKSTESLKPPPPQSSHPDREFGNPNIRVSSSSPPPPPPPLIAPRQLPPLFGGIRSSAKPGAALAAAAAASRSIPTPHAAAIKSRRSTILERRDSSTLSSSSSSVSSLPLVISDEFVADERGFLEETVGGNEDTAELNGMIHRSNDSEESRDFEDHNAVREKGHEAESSPGMIKEERENDASGALVNERICDSENIAEQDSGSIEDSNVAADGEVYEKEAKVADETKIPTKPCDVSKDDDGDDFNLMSEIDELVRERIEQLDSKKNGEKSEKKSQKPSLKPLELAEEVERKQASTGLHLEEGAAAQPMRLEGVKRGSIALGYFDINSDNVVTRTISSQAFRRDYGLPQVLGIHVNYIGIGMSKGVILVVPSRYSPYHVDNMDSKTTTLGSQGDRASAAVTSICFNQQGDLLLAGYSDGHITVWDLQRGSAAKVITGEHTAPVVHAFFLGQDSQVTRQFKAVTGDSNGLVLLHSFSVVPLLNRFSIKTQCLLDGQKTGTVISASPLLYDELIGGASLIAQGSTASSGSGFGTMMGGVVGADASWKLFNEAAAITEEGVVIFVTHQTALVVRLSPALKVYASLPRPDGVREGSMPYTAWKYMSQASAHSSDNISEALANERVALLAIAWDRKVQVAKLVNSEIKAYKKWSLDGPAIGVAWLDDQILVALTMSGQLCLFARDGTIIHQTTFAFDNFGGDDLITYNTYFVNVFGNPEKAYHNTVAVRGASVYILGPMHLIISRLLPWKERIQVLRKAGDWMGTLNMAMTLYDGQAHGVIDLPRTLDAVQDAIMPYLVDLLQSYVDEVFSYISVAFCNQMGKVQKMDDQIGGSSSLHDDIKEQFTRVGGVAVEFCVHIKRTDILFDEIYSKFVAVQHRETFLELLEPYILKDMLSSLPPEIMQALVEHYSSKGWLQRVEQCVLHMDISSLDFNQVVKLCREHGLYCALVYLFNRGLDDYRSPLEELLVVYHNTPRESAAALGYRMLVYLKYCFLGLAFPPGHGSLPQSRLPSLRKELVQFLLEESDDSRVAAKRSYINLYYLLELDMEATLDVLKCAFPESDIEKSHLSSDNSENQITQGGTYLMEEINFVVQDVVDTLVNFLNICIIKAEDGAHENRPVDASASRNGIGHLSEFIAYFVSCGRAMVSKDILAQILQNLTSEFVILREDSESHSELSKKREKQVLSLLKTVPENELDADYVLHLCEMAKFYQVCGFIHTIKGQNISALDGYMKDLDEPVHAFAFINDALLRLNETESAAFRSAIISRVPKLVGLSREGTFFLVMYHFSEEISDIFSELHSHPKSLFLYLKTVIEVHQSGILDFSSLTRDVDGHGVKVTNGPFTELDTYIKRISEFPQLLRNNPVSVSDDMMEHYLELLCQYERHSVLAFLETFDSYRVEHCLRLCQEYGIVDAAAFLLERVGDVGSALSLTLSSLNDKFEKLDAALRRIFSEVISSGSIGVEYFNTVLKLEEVNDIHKMLHDCIELCQRNTPRLNPEESEILWFRLLDTFCVPLMGSSDSKDPSCEGNHVGMVIQSAGSQDDEIGSIIKWRISRGVAPVLRKLFSQLIKEIVEGMIGYVRLPNIVSKLLSDNGSQEFGDFKLTILGMLGTYGFERRILDTAKSLIEDDTFYTMILLKRGASHGYAPRRPICCLCNCLLAKRSSSSGVRLFNCGHSTHIHCEILGGETSSKGSSSGCPICLPKNNQKSRNKGVLVESGLVTKFSSRSPQAQGTNNLHAHENQNDVSDGSYGLQQVSRFDILANLQKDNRPFQIENLPQLKLAPPAVYHEKVKKGIDFLNGENSNDVAKIEKPSKNRQLKEIKAKGSSIRFPLKTNIFGKERTSKR